MGTKTEDGRDSKTYTDNKQQNQDFNWDHLTPDPTLTPWKGGHGFPQALESISNHGFRISLVSSTESSSWRSELVIQIISLHTSIL